MCQRFLEPASKECCECRQYWQIFTRSKGKTKAQHSISKFSAESILILIESNWIQMRFGLSGLSSWSGLSGLSIARPSQSE